MSLTSDLLRGAETEAAQLLASPGDWLTGSERIGVWAEVRGTATDQLSRSEVEVVRRVTMEPGALDRSWADAVIAEIGEERYTEVVGVTATSVVLDRFRVGIGEALLPLPQSTDGLPARRRPDDVGDVGAWVSQTIEKTLANVSRALSLVPRTNDMWRVLVTPFYSRGPEFMELAWDRSLSRPQVELVAARTTALNECFY